MRSFASAAVIVLSGCASGFQEASATFAAATSRGLDAIGDATENAEAMCRERAQLSYLQRRIEGVVAQPDLGFARWYERVPFASTATATWKSHCERLHVADDMVARSTGALHGYARAMRDVLAVGGVDPEVVTSLASSGGGLAATVSGEDVDVGLIAGAAGPATEIVNFVVGWGVEQEVEATVQRLDGAVQTLIGVLRRYLGALRTELADQEALVADLRRSADRRLGESPAPADLLTVEAFARRERARVTRMRAALADIDRILGDIAAAHAALRGARHTDDEAAALERALAISTSILDFAAQLRARPAVEE